MNVDAVVLIQVWLAFSPHLISNTQNKFVPIFFMILNLENRELWPYLKFWDKK